MAKESRSHGWWQTVPGILTAVAGIITAVTGLILALNQVGFFGPANNQTPQALEGANNSLEPTSTVTEESPAPPGGIETSKSKPLEAPPPKEPEFDSTIPPPGTVTEKPPAFPGGLETSKSKPLEAPVPRKPECGSTIPWPPKGYFFILAWTVVEGASLYTVEVDCLGCSGRTWYSFRGSPWHVRTGLGLRSPIYSSDIHLQLRRAGGYALRWRVWAVDHEGNEGQKSIWCQVVFSGG